MDVLRCIGGCVPLFLLAVLLDVLGLVLIFVGIFADPRLEDRYYGDFLIYTGALVVFASLASWLMWYVGNVPVREDHGPGKRSSFSLLARKLSERLSQSLKDVEGAKCVRDQDRCSQAGSSSPRKASRVTWGKSATYSNQGYDDSMDSPREKRKDRTPVQGYEESVDPPDEDSKETPPDQGYNIFMDSPKEDRKETPLP